MVSFKKLAIFIFFGVSILIFWKRESIIQSDQPVSFKKPPLSNYSAWMPSWDQERSFNSLSASNHKLNFISPVWYSLEPDGRIKLIEGMDLEQLKIKAKDQGVSLLPTVFNSFDPKRVSLIINNQTQKQVAIDNLVKIAEDNQYLGWDLDFEELKLADKDAFSEFVKDLAKNLHQKGLLLSVSVHTQKGGLSDRESARAQDWVVLGKEADYIRIMAYDFHNIGTAPGPITPIDDLKAVLKKAVSEISSEKIILGLPLYGYNWIQGGQNTVTDYQTMKEDSKKLNFNLTRDNDSRSLTAKYKDNNVNNTVFVEDATSTVYKIELARKMGVYQFIFWRLGGEDPSLWVSLP